MPISINLWQKKIGTFGEVICKLCVKNTRSSITRTKFKHYSSLNFLDHISFTAILSNVIELNPGTTKVAPILIFL